MRPTALSDSLPMSEWQRLRRRDLSDGFGGARAASLSPSDDMPMDEWVTQREQALRADTFSGREGTGELRGDGVDDHLARQRPKAAAAAPTAGRPAPIDPSRTDVFRRGADGKLHPIPGWHTTGPFDVATWARNVDWPGVAEDFIDIAAGIPGFFIPPVLRGMDKAGIASGFWSIGQDTRDDLEAADRASGR